MEIAIIADTHWGIRGDNLTFMNSTKKFLDDVFFPEIDKRNIKCVVHLGDLFDRRKMTNTITAHRLRRDFIKPMIDRGIEYHQIIGNHDTYYKNTNEVNAVDEFYSFIDMKVYRDPAEVDFNGHRVLMMPWICDANRSISMEMISASNARYCFGHLELEGFDMYRGHTAVHGDKSALFDKFELTLSGHYHHRSNKSSIVYVGSHAQFTWSDYGDDRGFHVLSLEDSALTFIKNPYIMFNKIFYDDAGIKSIEAILDRDWGAYKDTMCKVIVQNKNNPYWFDLFCEKLENSNPIDFQVVEDHHNLDSIDEDQLVDEAESTLDIFKKHIYQIEDKTINVNKLEKVITELYNRAISMGVE